VPRAEGVEEPAVFKNGSQGGTRTYDQLGPRLAAPERDALRRGVKLHC
jgi:hypothetical protein